jgi:hypothetical protein
MKLTGYYINSINECLYSVPKRFIMPYTLEIAEDHALKISNFVIYFYGCEKGDKLQVFETKVIRGILDLTKMK